MAAENVSVRQDYSKDEALRLQHVSDLVHLFHHRNKNQHRRSVWWRHFCVFRKQLSALLADVKGLNVVPVTHVARSQKKARDPQIRIQLQRRTQFWQDNMVEKCQHAFSQVAADGRFGVLGLMLVASLAEVCQITGITARLEDLGQLEVEKALQRFADEGWDEVVAPQDDLAQPMEDVGEAVQREYASTGEATTVPERGSPRKVYPTPENTDSRKSSRNTGPIKKRRKTRDAIDDLFSGIG